MHWLKELKKMRKNKNMRSLYIIKGSGTIHPAQNSVTGYDYEEVI
ncbi:MAG: hypothetical protein ACP5NL_00705 [Thermoplasmata archaeon]